MQNMNVSENGINFIKLQEGLRLDVYSDTGGKLTIGYGHLLLHPEYYETITEEKARELLKDDLSVAENIINRWVIFPLNQNQFDALVSLVFNIGAGSFKTSTLLKLLNESDLDGAANEFDRWIHVGNEISDDLIDRRAAEKSLFLTPV